MTTIVLAAGLSSRMGCNKMLLDYRGKPVIAHVIEKAAKASDDVIVVTGHDRESLEAAISGYSCRTAFNKDYKEGQMGSIRCGLMALRDDDFAFIPGDLPLVTDDDFRKVFSALGSAECVRPEHNGIPGHPIAYRREYREKILSFPGKMKEFNSSIELCYIAGSAGTVFDIDTRERYEALLCAEDNPS